jgi:hypothetical protein
MLEKGHRFPERALPESPVDQECSPPRQSQIAPAASGLPVLSRARGGPLVGWLASGNPVGKTMLSAGDVGIPL